MKHTQIAMAVWSIYGRANPFFMAHKWHFDVVGDPLGFVLRVRLP